MFHSTPGEGMQPVTRVVCLRDVELQQRLEVHAERGWEYTEPMPHEDWAGRKTDLGLVLLPLSDSGPAQALWFVCLATKGKRWTTRYARALFTHLASLRPPLTVEEWLKAVPEQFRPHLDEAISTTGRPIPPGTWTHARAALVALRPQIADRLAELELILDARVELTPHEQEVIQEQKDAVGVALSVAGMKRTPLEAWTTPDNHASFLAGIKPGMAREDVMVIHDASRAPGWVGTSEPYIGVTEFADRANNRLTVMNVNRHKIEEVTGVDLLYYRHEPASFALVQYKRMTRRKVVEEDDGAATGSKGLEFRPSRDGAFQEELERMRTVEAHASRPRAKKAAKGQGELPLFDPVMEYRLHPRVCWIKLCHPEAFKPVDSDLVGGMYLPLDYYEQMIRSGKTIGPRGGRVITYDRVGRWINNSLFIDLLSGGWIGSQGLQTAWLRTTVEAALSAKRSVVVAEETSRKRRRHRR